MLDKHLFELNLISHIFQALFLNGIFWEVILKRFGFKHKKTQKKLEFTSHICYLSFWMMTMLRRIWSPPALYYSLGKMVECLEHLTVCNSGGQIPPCCLEPVMFPRCWAVLTPCLFLSHKFCLL
jgi:hypothetical protein